MLKKLFGHNVQSSATDRMQIITFSSCFADMPAAAIKCSKSSLNCDEDKLDDDESSLETARRTPSTSVRRSIAPPAL